jgi:hypothetical protein
MTIAMHAHHARAIQKIKEHFEPDLNVLAVLLTGSIAHGYQAESSDVDILIILSEEEYQKRLLTGQVTYVTRDHCEYPEGYVDGKYLAMSFIRMVAEKGSEPARFAFEGAQIIFSRIDNLEDQISRLVAYPVNDKSAQIKRFSAQLEAWNWYCSEALKKNNQYLLGVAVHKLVLFGGRLILAHNEMLYPYHKWFLKVLEKAQDQPKDLMPTIQTLVSNPTKANITTFYELIKGFQEWDVNPNGWGAQFMADSELNWMTGSTPVDDL